MRKADLIFLLCNFTAMILGIVLPKLGSAFDAIPPIMLMIQVLLSFLVSLHPTSPPLRHSLQGLGIATSYRLLLIPLVAWAIIYCILPTYAVSAILLGGISVAVLAPFLVTLVNGNVSLAIALVVTTSLFMPFTLPCLITFAKYMQGQSVSSELWGSFLRTGLYLSMYMIVPFIVAFFLVRFKLNWTNAILKRSFPVNLTCMGIALTIIYSRYSTPLLDSPMLIVESISVAFLLAAIFTITAICFSWKRPLDSYVTIIVCSGSTNCVLSTIVASQFLGLTEILVSSLYTIPLFCFVFVYRAARSYKERSIKKASVTKEPSLP